MQKVKAAETCKHGRTNRVQLARGSHSGEMISEVDRETRLVVGMAAAEVINATGEAGRINSNHVDLSVH